VKPGNWIPWVVGPLLVAGCADLKSLAPGKPCHPGLAEALVFGKIVIVENGRTIVPYNLWTTRTVPILYRAQTRKQVAAVPQVQPDGSFYWLLPRGTYVIEEIQFGYSLTPHIAFQVPATGQAFYLGNLTIAAETSWFLRKNCANSQVSVRDEFDQARGELPTRIPNVPAAPEKKLMIYSPAIPPSVFWEDQRWVRTLLNALTAEGDAAPPVAVRSAGATPGPSASGRY
jgi:hypothetical protein